MEDNREMICDRCRKSVPIPKMKYLSKSKDSIIALCPECRERYGSEKKSAEKIPPREKVKAEKLVSKKEITNKQKYKCDRCKYKFEYHHDGVTILKCPYCGKSDMVREVPGSF